MLAEHAVTHDPAKPRADLFCTKPVGERKLKVCASHALNRLAVEACSLIQHASKVLSLQSCCQIEVGCSPCPVSRRERFRYRAKSEVLYNLEGWRA